LKKKVLITACSMDIGGIERSLAGLLNAFDYEKYDVDLLLFSRKGELLIFCRCNAMFYLKYRSWLHCLNLLNPLLFRGIFCWRQQLGAERGGIFAAKPSG